MLKKKKTVCKTVQILIYRACIRKTERITGSKRENKTNIKRKGAVVLLKLIVRKVQLAIRL